MIELTFKQTQSEMMVRAAATVIFNGLLRAEFPNGRLSSITEHPQYGFGASASQENSGIKLVRITDLQDGKINWDTVPYCQCEQLEKYLLQPNDILFARTGATTGKTHLVKEAPVAVFASYLIRVRPQKEVRSDYLYYFFQSDVYWRQIIEEKEGSAQPNVNGQKLMNIEVPIVDNEIQLAISQFLEIVRQRQDGSINQLPELPPPLDGQRRIVARIEELAAKVEEARGLRRQSIEESEALVNATAFKAFTGFDSRNLLPIESICEVKGGIQKSSDRVPGANPRRYITVAHVQRNWIDTGDPRYFEVSNKELERWRLLPGDVLVIEGNGSADHIGRTALFRGEIEDCVHQNHVIRVRPNQAQLMPEYLNTYLNSPLGRDQMLNLSRTTSGLFTLSVGRIRSIEIPLPPLPEQHRIVAYFDDLQAKVDALKRLQAETAVELDALLPSILDKAFKGEL
ncbi:restriction endonuclease subunit S [Microcoleus sp. LEGE 07076]|jgi:type I restriction enzyme, S subunit|uniref:restriction endonuclease subunit S n=1 Tax=Microcoleus sp. LEGE 07076 TaxID=915322 RepID=UPI00187F549C|nr:restriction endonuclease subunit S [Microcoleus sp. LEGE 07076]MBE9188634.1 restriction endonuclease subunit S [Microcoleus sp. LEGE 07076]